MAIPIAPPRAAVLDALARTAGERAGGRSRALTLGRVASPLAEALRARGFDAVIGFSERFHRDPTRYPLAVAAGLLEYDPWDRWALQRVHHVLEPGGMLVLAAPRLISPATALEPAWALAMLDKQLRKRMRRPAPRFAGRRYGPRRLATMLDGLGFTGIEVAPLGAGHLRVVARRGPSMAGLSSARPAPERAAWLAAFEREHAASLAARDVWLSRHRPAPQPVRMFDPAGYAGRDVLVLAPHPDDEVIGCGGTLARLIAAGARVTQLQATDGSAAAAFGPATTEDERHTVRLAEAERVADMLGITETVMWREDNRAFRHRDGLVTRLAELLERVRPALVFTPFVTDVHPDHRTLCAILADALERIPELARGLAVMQYEVWAVIPPDTCCDVADQMAHLEDLLMRYETPLKAEDYIHFCETRRRYHAARVLGRDGFAEPFVTVPGAGYAEWFRAGGGPTSG